MCQAGSVARGWESKSVEAQMEAAEDRASLANRRALADEEIRLQRERESLELSRTRVLQDIASAANPRYREVLERSLGFLDDKLKALAAAKG
jgi:molecular chaperone GrpE (heat shock protein)